MTIPRDQLQAIWEAKKQEEDLISATAALEYASRVVQEELAKLKDIKTSGSFTMIPTELKNTLLAWEAMFDTLKTSFLADADVQSVYEWRP